MNKHVTQILIGALLSLPALVVGQSSDCDDAVSVCNQVYTETNSPAGTGQVFEMAPFTCQTGGEFNSSWYVFSPQNDGILNFTLEPNSLFDDYDWSLFDITDNGCGGINSGASPEVSCNSYGETIGMQGTTGISSASGGFGNSNGPGNINGPPFNSDLNVTEGSVYALVIMNFSATLDGYTLDFSGNTANIFDADPPTLEDVAVECDNQTVNLTFSESVHLDLTTVNSFTLTDGNGTTATATSIVNGGSEWGSQLTLNFGTPLTAGTYTLGSSINAPVLDICGNPWPGGETLTVYPLAELEFTTDDACNGAEGSILLNILNSDEGTFDIDFEGTGSNAVEWNDLAPGSYDITVTNEQGCSVDETVTLNNANITLNAGADQQLCDLQTTLNANFSGGSFSWEADPSITFSSLTSPTTQVSSSTAINKTLTCMVTQDDCVVTDEVTISFAFPPETSMSRTEISCYDACDATLEIVNGSDVAITAILNNSSLTGNEMQFENICAGNYQLRIIHSPGCESTQNISFSNPGQVLAGFDATDWFVSITEPTVTLTSTSENADSLHWQVIGQEIDGQGETFEITLPKSIGFYEVELMATDSNGCSNRVSAFIEVRDAFRFYVPNSFTPNEDDVNDIFYVNCNYPPDIFDLKIYNRFGDIVYQSKDYKDVWVGDVHSGEYFAGNGVYNWQLLIGGTELEPQTFTGFITIIR